MSSIRLLSCISTWWPNPKTIPITMQKSSSGDSNALISEGFSLSLRPSMSSLASTTQNPFSTFVSSACQSARISHSSNGKGISLRTASLGESLLHSSLFSESSNVVLRFCCITLSRMWWLTTRCFSTMY